MRKPTDIFALLIGAFLLIEGFWGLTSDVVFGVLTTNRTHAIIHIVLGGFCIFLGALLLAVGALRFVPGAADLIVQLLNVNPAVAVLNIAVGAVALLLAFAGPKGAVRNLQTNVGRIKKI